MLYFVSTLDDDYWASQNGGVYTTGSTSFTLVMQNPCRTSTLRTTIDSGDVNFPNVLVSSLGPSISIDITVLDEASVTYRNYDGLTLCGQRTYTLAGGHTDEYGDATILATLSQTTAPGDTMTVQSTDVNDSNFFTYSSRLYNDNLNVCLNDYLADVPCVDIAFTIEV